MEIVETPENAINCFINTDIDALLIENFILIKLNIDQNIFLSVNLLT